MEGVGVKHVACSNLVPVRSRSVIPDYGPLGLRHADARLCAHLQATDFNLGLKPVQSRLLPSGKSGFHTERVFGVVALEHTCCLALDAECK